MLTAAYFEAGFAPALNARALMEGQGGLPLRTRRRQNFARFGRRLQIGRRITACRRQAFLSEMLRQFNRSARIALFR
jgi:hypothetical protein